MLKYHFDSVEKSLLATSAIPAGSGHTIHKGTPREIFVRDFLTDHLSKNAQIGTGEIIDSDSKPGARRHQLDIVLHRGEFPRLNFGGGINAFLAESVVATVEVKSLLDAEAMKQAVEAAASVKSLKRHFYGKMTFGYQPPSILSYLVAYDGPSHMSTVYGWLPHIHAQLGIQVPAMPAEVKKRYAIPSPSIDLILVLGKGVLYFDNSPLGFLPSGRREKQPEDKWVWANQSTGNLLFFFLHLTQAFSGQAAGLMNPLPYVSAVTISNVGAGV